MFDKILNDEPIFRNQGNAKLVNLMKGLLEKNPEKRMEFVRNIKTNEFFSEIDFQKVLRK